MKLSINDIYKIVGSVLKMDEDKKEKLPLKLRWKLENNITKMKPIAMNFEKTIASVSESINKNFFNDPEKTIRIVNEDGSEVAKIKDEYIETYKKEVEDLNGQLVEIASEEREIDIQTYDIDSFIDSLPDDTPLTFDDLKILQFMNEG